MKTFLIKGGISLVLLGLMACGDNNRIEKNSRGGIACTPGSTHPACVAPAGSNARSSNQNPSLAQNNDDQSIKVTKVACTEDSLEPVCLNRGPQKSEFQGTSGPVSEVEDPGSIPSDVASKNEVGPSIRKFGFATDASSSNEESANSSSTDSDASESSTTVGSTNNAGSQSSSSESDASADTNADANVADSDSNSNSNADLAPTPTTPASGSRANQNNAASPASPSAGDFCTLYSDHPDCLQPESPRTTPNSGGTASNPPPASPVSPSQPPQTQPAAQPTTADRADQGDDADDDDSDIAGTFGSGQSDELDCSVDPSNPDCLTPSSVTATVGANKNLTASEQLAVMLQSGKYFRLKNGFTQDFLGWAFGSNQLVVGHNGSNAGRYKFEAYTHGFRIEYNPENRSYVSYGGTAEDLRAACHNAAWGSACNKQAYVSLMPGIDQNSNLYVEIKLLTQAGGKSPYVLCAPGDVIFGTGGRCKVGGRDERAMRWYLVD